MGVGPHHCLVRRREINRIIAAFNPNTEDELIAKAMIQIKIGNI